MRAGCRLPEHGYSRNIRDHIISESVIELFATDPAVVPVPFMKLYS